jgi:hypothetical protein
MSKALSWAQSLTSDYLSAAVPSTPAGVFSTSIKIGGRSGQDFITFLWESARGSFHTLCPVRPRKWIVIPYAVPGPGETGLPLPGALWLHSNFLEAISPFSHFFVRPARGSGRNGLHCAAAHNPEVVLHPSAFKPRGSIFPLRADQQRRFLASGALVPAHLFFAARLHRFFLSGAAAELDW